MLLLDTQLDNKIMIDLKQFFKLVPLGRVYPLTASEFYQKLMEEAENERKAKKRNQLSGIYK
jgi:hypothetical protein